MAEYYFFVAHLKADMPHDNTEQPQYEWPAAVPTVVMPAVVVPVVPPCVVVPPGTVVVQPGMGWRGMEVLLDPSALSKLMWDIMTQETFTKNSDSYQFIITFLNARTGQVLDQRGDLVRNINDPTTRDVDRWRFVCTLLASSPCNAPCMSSFLPDAEGVERLWVNLMADVKRVDKSIFPRAAHQAVWGQFQRVFDCWCRYRGACYWCNNIPANMY